MIYIFDELVLFLLNPFGMLVAMALLIYLERIVIKSIKNDIWRNNAIRLKLKKSLVL